MREIIKKILRENSEDNFDWFEDVESKPITNNTQRYNLIYNLISEVKSYGDWDLYIGNTDGVVYWSSYKYPGFNGLASPEWSEEFEIPVDVESRRDYYSITTITTPEFQYDTELIYWYKNEYFKKISEILTKAIEDIKTKES